MRGVFILLLVLMPLPSRAQLVVGRVLDEGGTAPVGGAVVEALAGRATQRASVTDSTGSFRLALAAPGRYTLRVHHVAYVAYTSDPLEIARGESIDIEVRLGTEVIALEPLVVIARSTSTGRLAGFRERLDTNAFGKFVTRDAIEGRPGALVTDFFRTMAGVTVVPVKRGGNPMGMTTQMIMMRGRGHEAAPVGGDNQTQGLCEPGLWLDGVRVRQSASYPIDDLLHSTSLEGIEVYASAASAPLEYQGQANCGVVLLWTRDAAGAGRSGWKRWAAGLGLFATIIFFGIF